MANFVFETMSQADAATFSANDYLVFITSGTTAFTVTVTPASGDQLTNNGLVLTSGAKSLTFAQSSLSGASTSDHIVFNDGSHLILGTNTGGGDFITNNASGLHSNMTDVVYGFAGNDVLGDSSAGAGNNNGNNDYVYGGAGSDTIYGGGGNDHLYGFGSTVNTTDGADTIMAGSGDDYLQGNGGNDLLIGGDGQDRIFGGADADSILGGAGLDTINGNLGNDTIDGGLDNDFIRGGQGNDSIMGGEGNDQLLGDIGSDTLSGGAGLDVLTGGDGSDVFAFNGAGDATFSTAAGQFQFFTDLITDYTDGTDKIDLPFTVNSVLTGPGGASFTSFSAAQVYAQQLLDGHTGAGEVAAVKVNSDTILFYNSAGTDGTTIDSAIKVANVDTTVFNTTGTSDFI